MTDREKLAAAIELIARRVVRNAVFAEIESGRVSQYDFDEEITEQDWDAISFRARTIADSIERGSNEEYLAACELLESRASGD